MPKLVTIDSTPHSPPVAIRRDEKKKKTTRPDPYCKISDEDLPEPACRDLF